MKKKVDNKENIFNILEISDIHFGATKNSEKLYNELSIYFIKKIKELKNKLDIVVINGDLFDKVVSTNDDSSIYASKFILELNNLSIKYNFYLTIVKGTRTHEFNQLENFRKLEILNPKFNIFNKLTIFNYCKGDKELSALILPEEYVEDISYYDDYINKLDDKYYDVIFGHGTLDFAGYTTKLIESEKQVKNAVTFNTNKLNDIAYLGLFGHVHIHMNKGNMYYSGSFSRFSFGETEDKGFYYIKYDIDTGEYEIDFIVNEDAPTYITIDLNDKPEEFETIEEFIEYCKDNFDFIRIKALDNVDNQDNITLLKEYAEVDNQIKLQVTKTIEKEEIDKKFDYIINRELELDETIQRFIKEEMGKNISLGEIKKYITEEDE